MTSFSWIWRFQHLKILGKLYSSDVLCPNVAIFLKNVFIFKDRTLKKNNIERTRISTWFGRENDENVVRTRDWCGWPSSPRWADNAVLKRNLLGFIWDLSDVFMVHICLGRAQIQSVKSSSIVRFEGIILKIGFKKVKQWK